MRFIILVEGLLEASVVGDWRFVDSRGSGAGGKVCVVGSWMNLRKGLE